MTETTELQEKTGITPTEGLVQAFLPWAIEGDNKAAYLGYLIAGFSKAESAKLAGIHYKTPLRWSDPNSPWYDKAFTTFISKIPEVRKDLSNQMLDLEYTRNFKLVLSKDFRVLLKDATKQPMTEQEVAYLNIIRKFYTPQHLGLLRQLLAGNTDVKEDALDWTKTVLEIRLSKEETHGKRS